MKTIKFIALVIFAFVVLNSCIDGDSCTCPEPENWYSKIFEAKADKWVLVECSNEPGPYYEYIFDNLPYVDGIISVYMFIDYNKPSEIQLPLPYTEYGVDMNSGPYSVQYSYDIQKNGTIAFKIYVSDYKTGLLELLTEYFRVTIVY
jgi:hypothetical protein